MSHPKYIEQYLRVKRWYERFKIINEDKKHDMTSDHYQDEMYAFFMNCHHLKDWVSHDKESGFDQKLVDNLVKNNLYLKICSDICNGSKHLHLNNPNGAKVSSRHFSLGLGLGSPLINVKYKIQIEDQEYDAFTVATEAIKIWENFLCENSSYFKNNFKFNFI